MVQYFCHTKQNTYERIKKVIYYIFRTSFVWFMYAFVQKVITYCFFFSTYEVSYYKKKLKYYMLQISESFILNFINIFINVIFINKYYIILDLLYERVGVIGTLRDSYSHSLRYRRNSEVRTILVI